MAKTIFEQTGGTYTMQGDYYLPNLTLPPEEERPKLALLLCFLIEEKSERYAVIKRYFRNVQ